MADVTKTVVKDFNLPLLTEEIAATVVPAYGLMLAGFDRGAPGFYTAFSAAKVIGTISDSTGVTEDIAQPGELRFEFRNPLTGPEDTALDAALAAHNATVRTAEQIRKAQDGTDATQLLADYPNYAAMTAAQKNAVNEMMLRLVVRNLLGKNAEI